MQYLNKFKLCSKPSETSCRLKWAPYTTLAQNNLPALIIHLIFYAAAGAIIFFETIHTNLADVFKYKCRYAALPLIFILSVIYIICREINNAFRLLSNPFMFLDYFDVFGSIFCFSAVFLGIVSVLHI